jgi:hypothetical protein
LGFPGIGRVFRAAHALFSNIPCGIPCSREFFGACCPPQKTQPHPGPRASRPHRAARSRRGARPEAACGETLFQLSKNVELSIPDRYRCQPSGMIGCHGRSAPPATAIITQIAGPGERSTKFAPPRIPVHSAGSFRRGNRNMTESDLLARITINPAIFGGKPIIRGSRMAVEHVLGMLAAGRHPRGHSGGISLARNRGYPRLPRFRAPACRS